ncbi:hypothetical protein M5689_012436 [Euphorbia peplus]|nr:hypothetical protein M5689_012436 [Euphorbia peplus]
MPVCLAYLPAKSIHIPLKISMGNLVRVGEGYLAVQRSAAKWHLTITSMKPMCQIAEEAYVPNGSSQSHL